MGGTVTGVHTTGSEVRTIGSDSMGGSGGISPCVARSQAGGLADGSTAGGRAGVERRLRFGRVEASGALGPGDGDLARLARRGEICTEQGLTSMAGGGAGSTGISKGETSVVGP